MQSTGLMNARNYQGSLMRKMEVAFHAIAPRRGSYLPHDNHGSLINLLGASMPTSSAAIILALDAEGLRTLRNLLGIFCRFS